tara:strand:+ start:385 stop:840 length:456 start_codon:yes stop_codon:yes gene_type:complete
MNKIIASLLCFSLMTNPLVAIADEPAVEGITLDLRITELALGEKAPFAGILLTPDSLTKIENDNKLKILFLENQHSFDLQRLRLRLDAETALRSSERQLHEDIFQSQLKRIESLEELAINKRPDWVLPVAILTSFVVGAGVTVGITYAVNQ